MRPDDNLERHMGQLTRIGRVSAVDGTTARARVLFEDADDLVSDWLPVVQTRGYWMPDAGDLVLCSFLAQALEIGFITGKIYSAADAAPETDAETHLIAGSEVKLGDEGATLGAARRTDPIERNAAMEAWMDLVQTATAAFGGPPTYPPPPYDPTLKEIGNISAGSDVVKIK